VWSDSSRPVQLSAVRGSRFGCDCANVLGVSEARHLLAWLTAVDQLTPVAETTQAQGRRYITASSRSSSSSVNSTCRRYAPTAGLIHSSLRQVPHISHAKLIATGPCAPKFT